MWKSAVTTYMYFMDAPIVMYTYKVLLDRRLVWNLRTKFSLSVFLTCNAYIGIAFFSDPRRVQQIGRVIIPKPHLVISYLLSINLEITVWLLQ